MYPQSASSNTTKQKEMKKIVHQWYNMIYTISKQNTMHYILLNNSKLVIEKYNRDRQQTSLNNLFSINLILCIFCYKL